MRPKRTLMLTRNHVASLLTMDECISAIEHAFRLHAEEKTIPPAVLGLHADNGGFHVKAAGLKQEKGYAAVKINANFPSNRQRFGLPTIQGVIALFDTETGSLLALMDSTEITALRTAATTAVAAKHLARTDSRTATICGCGIQGRAQIRALVRVRNVEKIFAWDLDPSQASSFAAAMSSELRLPVHAVSTPGEAVPLSDVCITCTPSRKFYLLKEDIRPGTFVAAVGADNPEKQEIQPSLLAHSKVVVDHMEQCATIGDLHHALVEGVMVRKAVHAELWEIVAGRKPGRLSPQEITIFDSTGVALEDVAVAARAFERANAEDCGIAINIAN